MARSWTLEQLATKYWSYADISPAAWMAPMQLPLLWAFWANTFDATMSWYDQSLSPAGNTLMAVNAAASDVGCSVVWPGGLVPYVGLTGASMYWTYAAAMAPTGSFSVGGWFYVATASSYAEQGIVSKWEQTAGNNRGYRVILPVTVGDAPGISFWASSLGTSATVKYVLPVCDSETRDTWNFFCGRFESGVGLSAKINEGAFVSTTMASAAVFDNNRAFEIGRERERNTYCFTGRIAQVWMTHSKVSDTFVHWLYNAQAPLFGREREP